MISSRLSQIQDQVAYPSDLVSRSDSPDGTVVTLTINNAVRANCLSTPVLTALLAVIKSINSQISLDHSIDKEDPVEFAERVRRSHAPNPVPKVVIIKSAGNIFCSGHDLREIHSADGDYITIHNVFDLCNTVMLSIQRLPQIVISQVFPGVFILTVGSRSCNWGGGPIGSSSGSLRCSAYSNVLHSWGSKGSVLHDSLGSNLAEHTASKTGFADVTHRRTIFCSTGL